jgi:hypothetical protein
MVGSRGAALGHLALLAALAGVAGCASGGSTGTARHDLVQIEVRNDLVPGRGVTVRLVSQSDSRFLLGSVSPGQTRSFRLRRPGLRGSHHFTADPDGGAIVSGQTITSQTVALAPGRTALVWRLSTNFLTVTDASGHTMELP